MTSNTRICNYYTYSHYPSCVQLQALKSQIHVNNFAPFLAKCYRHVHSVFIIIMDSDITLMIRHKLTECYTYIKHLS